MSSLTHRYLDAIRLGAGDASTLAALGEFKGRQELFQRQTPELLATLRDDAIVESVESSNRIEGVTAPLDRIEAVVRNNSTPRDRSEQEIAGYRDALALVHESALAMTFSVNVILQLHTMLYRYHAGNGGRWKMTHNEIVERTADGTVHRVRFKPPGPVETPRLMQALETQYGRAVTAGHEHLLIAPLAILDFLCIHPFSDGNGRASRLLTLMLHYHAGLDVGRYVSLERIVEDSRETYYEALEASSRGWQDGTHDPIPWLRYFWGMTIRAYKEFEDRVANVRVGRGGKTDVVEQAIARRVGAFSISEIEADAPGVSRDWVRRVLQRMKAEGRLELHGRGRGAKYTRTDR